MQPGPLGATPFVEELLRLALIFVTSRALTAAEMGAEFGRSAAWIYANWERLVSDNIIPPPLKEAGHLVWSKAQVWAYLDRDLPPKMRSLVAAHRAAEEAAAKAPADYAAGDVIERDRAELNRRAARGFVKQER